MNNFAGSIVSSSSDNESSDEDDLVLHKLLSAARNRVQQRGESSNTEKRHRISIYRDRMAAHELLVRDYFAPDSLYDLSKFEDRFRISRNLFLRIARDLENNYEFFQLRWDARGKRGFSTLQKCTAALRQLAYGIAADASDEYLKMSERTGRECAYLFCEYVIELYGDIYLRHPTRNDIEQLYAAHEAKHGLPRMLDSIDCTHWEWANCPNAWRGQFTRGDQGVLTIILEAVASHDLWIWHAFFGMAGSNNDMNVLGASPIFNDILQGKAPNMPFVVNEHQYNYGYYLGDGIYPEYATFVKSYSFPADEKRKLFRLAQESARKDVEQTFGVLKQKWHIIKHPTRSWDRAKLTKVLTACVILHNMITEEEGRAICMYNPEDILNLPAVIQVGSPAYFTRVLEIQNSETHRNLRYDLTDHIWQRQHDGVDNDGDDDEQDDE